MIISYLLLQINFLLDSSQYEIKKTGLNLCSAKGNK